MHKVCLPDRYTCKQIVVAKLFIDTNFQEKIDLELIADQACFSKFHFHRIFKRYYEETPLAYITYLRLNKSKSLLSEGVMIKHVCYSVGFESLSSFIKLFKKNELMTPSEYAKIESVKKKQIEQNPLTHIPASYAQYLGWNC